MLQLLGVTKSFGAIHAVGPVDFSIERARTTVLIGPSGCGKSTLLRMMIGLAWPDSGTVIINGTPVTKENALDLRRRIGYVIQDGGLFPHLTSSQNAAIMGRHLKWSRQAIDDRITQLAELTHFPADGLRRFPAELSGGQRQRVALMRALFLDPDIILLDEPLAALDPMIRSGLQADLREIFQRLRKTVVLVTHDLGEAGFFADHVVLLRGGKIVQQGTLEDLVFDPADPFVTAFIKAQRGPLDSLKERSR